MSKFKIVDQDGMDCAGGETFDTQTDCETWIDVFASGDESLEIFELTSEAGDE